MVPISGDIRKVLAQTVIKEHQDDYSIVFIDPGQEKEALGLLGDLKPFTSYTITAEEVSLVLRTSDWTKLSGNFPRNRSEEPYRLITFDIVLDLSIVGFLSVISTALAESGVSVYAISTYLKDHILVKKGDAVNAIGVINSLISEARAE